MHCRGQGTLRGAISRLLVVAAAAVPLTALAAEPSPTPATADKQSTLRKVVVTENEAGEYTVEASEAATPLPLTLRETPQSLTVVTRARLDDQKLESLRDVLDSTAGVYSYAYDTERVLFTSRGFVIDNLMYDGVPAVTNFDTDSIDETLDTALYERIEIVRGATGLMTGAGSPAASVNLVRKHADSKVFAGDLGVTVGRWSDRRFEADLSTPLTADGSIRARTVAVYQDRDSFQNLYSNERKVFYGVIDADLSPDALLTVGIDYQDNDPSSNTWGSFPLYLADGSRANWSRSVTTSTDWASWNRTKKTAFTELRYAFADDWSLRASLTWRRFKEDTSLFYVYGFPDPQTGEGLDPFAYRSDGEITERTLDLQASGTVNLFGEQHDVVIGFNRSRVDNDGLEYEHGDLAPMGNFFEWDGSYPKPEFDSEGILVNALDTWQNGLYLAGRFVLAEPLKLVAGMRYSTWKSEGSYIYEAAGASSNFDYEKIIPYAGLVWDINRQFTAFASYTGIFKPQGNRDARGALLDPIDGSSIEAGIKSEHFDGRLNTALTLFETKQTNVATAVYDPDTGDAILLPGGKQASRAIDGTKTRGFEFELTGEIAQGWNASLGWSHYQLDDADGRAVRTFVPRTLVRGFTSWSPSGLQHLTLGGGINWQSKSSTFVGTPDGGTTLEQSDVTLLSLMARYQVTPKVSLQFNTDNLLDENYYVLDEFDNTYFGTPVSYSLSVQLKL